MGSSFVVEQGGQNVTIWGNWVPDKHLGTSWVANADFYEVEVVFNICCVQLFFAGLGLLGSIGTNKIAKHNKKVQAEYERKHGESQNTDVKVNVGNVNVHITPGEKYSKTEQEIKSGNLVVGHGGLEALQRIGDVAIGMDEVKKYEIPGNFVAVVTAILGIVSIKVDSKETFQAFIVINMILLCWAVVTVVARALAKEGRGGTVLVGLVGVALVACLNIVCVAYGYKYAFGKV